MSAVDYRFHSNVVEDPVILKVTDTKAKNLINGSPEHKPIYTKMYNTNMEENLSYH